MTVIYKIVPLTLWREAEESGVFKGAPIDLSDGYIHFSTAEQVAETAALHFAGQKDLLLIAVDGSMLAEPERWADLPDQVREWLEIQKLKSVLPSRADLLVETFPNASRYYMVMYPFEGRLAHQTLGMNPVVT